MHQTAELLAELCDLHLIILVDEPWEVEPHNSLTARCQSAEFVIRLESREFGFGAILPHAVREFANPDLEWLIHRQLYLHQIDVFQMEYTNMGQYAGRFRQILNALFEHDIYFQSIASALRQPGSPLRKLGAGFEYLRALRYELRMLPSIDLIQVCSRENKDYLASFLPPLEPRLRDDLRAGIDTARYAFTPEGREPDTMLFLGSFRHLPNQEALEWFARHVVPHVLDECPEARLVIVGSDPPPRHSLPVPAANLEIRGFVDDVHEPLRRYAVFVCPILSGSGVRVKLLEAFASGIPVVSTRLGAEGLAWEDGEVCALADDPVEFAHKILWMFRHPQEAREMTVRARRHVVETRDMRGMAARLAEAYKAAIQQKRGRPLPPASGPL